MPARPVGPRETPPSICPGLPPEFLTAESRVAEEVVLEPAPATRGREAAAGGLDLTYDLEPGQTAVLAIRHPSGRAHVSPAGSIHQPRGARARRRCGSRSPFGRRATRGAGRAGDQGDRDQGRQGCRRQGA